MVWVLEHSQLTTKTKFMVKASFVEYRNSGLEGYLLGTQGLTPGSFQLFILNEVRNISTPELLEEFDPWLMEQGPSLKGVGGSD